MCNAADMASISAIRRILYRTARVLGDAQAVKNKRVSRRVGRRIAGRITGRGPGRLFR
jgi:hypothetical protein